MKISIVDYGMGNILSVKNALNYLGAANDYSNQKHTLLSADKIILPGVGSYRKAMQNIKQLGLDKVICEAASNGTPILGICLGMQLLGNSSTEDAFTEGLCLFDGVVDKLDTGLGEVKIPHIGFSEVEIPANSALYKNITSLSDFYFVHSYRMVSNLSSGIAYARHGEKFIASFEQNNIFGTQFHPEKSQNNGLMLLKNFIEL